MKYKSTGLVKRYMNTIFVKSLDNPKVVSEFVWSIRDAEKKGFSEFVLDFSGVEAVFPNVSVPISGIIEKLIDKGKSVSFVNDNKNIKMTRMLSPVFYDEATDYEKSHILNKVWKFSSSEEVGKLVYAFMTELQKLDRFHKGMLDSVEWALNEVIDNVIQHSSISEGYVMGQIHNTSKYIAFTVFDTGQGIYNSLKTSEHAPKNTVDAITMAIKEEVTRDKKIGQGNGLYGLHSIVKQGKGRLCITSGSGSYMYENEQIHTYDNIQYLSSESPCTIVDFQLDYSEDLSLDKALVFRGKEYKPINIRLENLEDDFGNVIYKIKDNSEGTGTRESAKRVKNEIFNILQTEPKTIVLDFSGVAVISSSFADELIAKLLMELGLYQFNRVIRLKNLDSSLQNILQRSVIQRFIEDFNQSQESKESVSVSDRS